MIACTWQSCFMLGDESRWETIMMGAGDETLRFWNAFLKNPQWEKVMHLRFLTPLVSMLSAFFLLCCSLLSDPMLRANDVGHLATVQLGTRLDLNGFW